MKRIIFYIVVALIAFFILTSWGEMSEKGEGSAIHDAFDIELTFEPEPTTAP